MKIYSSFYKFSLTLLLISFVLINISCSGSYNRGGSTKNWTHFSIVASINDDIIFYQLQEDLKITPKMKDFSLTVNLNDKRNQFVVIGNAKNNSAKVYSWNLIRKSVQQGLLNWDGDNKENLDKL